MINKFRGEYSWLSNFAKCEIVYKNTVYPSVENAYQSAKNNDEEWKKFCSTENAIIVKKNSHKIILIENWNFIKLSIMEELLRQKFIFNDYYKKKLIETKDEYIEEGNTWHDTFWGVNIISGKGENHLGKLIMQIRDYLLK